jgi:hypothetical protein
MRRSGRSVWSLYSSHGRCGGRLRRCAWLWRLCCGEVVWRAIEQHLGQPGHGLLSAWKSASSWLACLLLAPKRRYLSQELLRIFQVGACRKYFLCDCERVRAVNGASVSYSGVVENNCATWEVGRVFWLSVWGAGIVVFVGRRFIAGLRRHNPVYSSRYKCRNNCKAVLCMLCMLR